MTALSLARSWHFCGACQGSSAAFLQGRVLIANDGGALAQIPGSLHDRLNRALIVDEKRGI
jgi:hypothetical protein